MLKKEISAIEIPQEVEISYTEQSLIDKLNTHGIKPSNLLSTLKVNQTLLARTEQSELNTTLEPAQINSFLIQLGYALKNWQANINFTDFTANINQIGRAHV